MANVKEYSVEEKLISLLDLQKIESKLDVVQILKGELPIEVSDLEDEIQGLHARETRIEEEVNGINEFIEQKKTLIADAQALVKKYEKQSENVKNNREFEAINKEIEMQTLEIKLAEKHIRDAQEEIGEKARLLDTAKKNIAAKDTNLKHKKGELEKIIGETQRPGRGSHRQGCLRGVLQRHSSPAPERDQTAQEDHRVRELRPYPGGPGTARAGDPRREISG
jgi:predicted  nucleic acid-binding Zn-ribbon protein